MLFFGAMQWGVSLSLVLSYILLITLSHIYIAYGLQVSCFIATPPPPLDSKTITPVGTSRLARLIDMCV